MIDVGQLPESADIGDVDRIIHEPARLLIMAHLYVLASADFVYLMNQTKLTRGNLGGHLAKIESAGYVTVEKVFVNRIPRTIYSMTEVGRAAFRTYRQNLKQFFDDWSE